MAGLFRGQRKVPACDPKLFGLAMLHVAPAPDKSVNELKPHQPVSDPGSDKRGSARRRTVLAGKIVYGNGAFSTPCTIRDIADGGARVKLTSPHITLPATVMLIDVRQGAAYVSEVAWDRPPEYGLRFTARYDMNALPTEHAYLRRIWVDASVR